MDILIDNKTIEKTMHISKIDGMCKQLNVIRIPSNYNNPDVKEQEYYEHEENINWLIGLYFYLN